MSREEDITKYIELLKINTNKEKMLEAWFKEARGTQLELEHPLIQIPGIIRRWDTYFHIFEENWILNPEWRLPQVLINSGIMKNYPGIYYYKEDDEILKILKDE